MSDSFHLPQAKADGRRSRDAGQRVIVLRQECEEIAKLAAPEDSVDKIAEKLGGSLPASTVHRRIQLMRDDLAQSGDAFIPSRDPTRTPVAGRIARLWAKYRL